MGAYVARTAGHFGRFLAMPNVIPPLTGGQAVADYRRSIESALSRAGRAVPEVPEARDRRSARPVPAARSGSAIVLPTFKLVPGMGRDAVLSCAAAGAIAGKYYPAGATTNASDGVTDPSDVAEELSAMQDAGLVLSIHGEDPGAPALEREAAFLPVVDRLVAAYPRLRIVLEHLSTAAAVDAVSGWPDRVAATLTAHHLSFTIDDLLGDRLRTSLFCKPVLKYAADMDALVKAAVSGSPRFFFGSDSAPHPPAAKAGGAAGSYSAPVAMALVAAVFDRAGALPLLERFVSENGARFYGLPPNTGRLNVYEEEWVVPALVDDVEPLCAGMTLRWQAGRLPQAHEMRMGQ